MITSGGGGADDWGWSTPQETPGESAPPRHAPQNRVAPQNSGTPPDSGASRNRAAPQNWGAPQNREAPPHAGATGKPRPKWIPILAVLALIPLGIAIAFFGVDALRDARDGNASTGLIVDGAGGSGGAGGAGDAGRRGFGNGGSGDGPSGSMGPGSGRAPGGTVKEDSERTHFRSGDVSNDDLDAIRTEPFFKGGSNPENVRMPADREYRGTNFYQEDMRGSADPTTFGIRIGIDGDDGWVVYPSLGCSGTLRFIGTQGGTGVYEEVITSGKRNCADTGTWWFRVVDESKSTVAGFYESTEGRWRVSGSFLAD